MKKKNENWGRSRLYIPASGLAVGENALGKLADDVNAACRVARLVK
jgi:hypothetical protein